MMKLIMYFEEIMFDHIRRDENHLVDALATLTFVFKVKWENEVTFIIIMRLDESEFFVC